MADILQDAIRVEHRLTRLEALVAILCTLQGGSLIIQLANWVMT